MEEKKYYWTDIESGVTFECSKEYREAMLKNWEACKPKLIKDGKPIGVVLLTGTPSSSEKRSNT